MSNNSFALCFLLIQNLIWPFKKFRTKNCEKNPTSEDRKNKYIKERQNKMERREKENIYGDFHCFLVKEMKRLRKLQRQVSALI